MKKGICFLIMFFSVVYLFAGIEYIGKCTQIEWDSGEYYQVARKYFPIETVEMITNRRKAESYLLLIILTGREPTKAEKDEAERRVEKINRYTYWENLEKIDIYTQNLLEKELLMYDFSEGEIYKIQLYDKGFLVRISSGNRNSYSYSYYSYERKIVDK